MARRAPAAASPKETCVIARGSLPTPLIPHKAPVPSQLEYKQVDAAEFVGSMQDPDAPKNQWPKLPAAQVHASRQQILALAQKWDDKQTLCMIPASEVDCSEAVGAFCIPNRLMLNPTVINSRNLRYLVFTKSLAREYIACGISTMSPG